MKKLNLKMKWFAALLLVCLICPSALAKCWERVNFKIEAFSDFHAYSWQTNVFGIKIVATNKSRFKLQHVAQVLAELIDNDNDGCPDDAKAFKILVEGIEMDSGEPKKPVFLISDNGDGHEGAQNHLGDSLHEVLENAGYYPAQYLSIPEVKPHCTHAQTFTANCVDATQEELTHWIHQEGFCIAYPEYFNQDWHNNGWTSALTRAMDVARGGRREDTPSTLSGYPASAWYRYVDTTCDYQCQAIEYFWWGYLSYSGTGNGLGGINSFSTEFKLVKKADLIARDKLLAKLFQDSENGNAPYKLPFRAVHGSYTGCTTCNVADLKSHGGSTTTHDEDPSSGEDHHSGEDYDSGEDHHSGEEDHSYEYFY